jgi:hypothetical protein
MDTVSNPPAVRDRVGRPLWYFALAGALAGGAVLTSAVVPAEIYGLFWGPAAIGFSFVDRAITRSSPVAIRLRREVVVYVVVAGVLLVGALIAAAIFVRQSDSDAWVVWAISGLAFTVVAVAGWALDRRLSEVVPTRPPS